jgi:hypothetical protein
MTVRFQNVLASMMFIIFLLIAALNGFTIDAVKSTNATNTTPASNEAAQ